MDVVLATPTGPDAVRHYRFKNADLGQKYTSGESGREIIRWLEKKGMEWAGWWTNWYEQEGHAISAVMSNFDVPVIAEVDDFFDGVAPGNLAYKAWHHQRRLLYRHLLKNSDRIVVSTPFLKDCYGGEVAPNFVREELWDFPKRQKDDDSVVLLHCGSVNRAEDYLQKEAAFRAFLREPNAKIIFMGWMPSWAKQYRPGKVVFCRGIEYEKYNQMVRWLAPDLLVSPMETNDFNLAKSNIKWLEAGMAEACFVGERWGEYERTVEEGVDGVLADGVEEWTDVLVELARDQDLRKSVAEKGNEAVMEKWTWPAVKGQWEKAVLGVENGAGTERVSGSPEQHTAAAR